MQLYGWPPLGLDSSPIFSTQSQLELDRQVSMPGLGREYSGVPKQERDAKPLEDRHCIYFTPECAGTEDVDKNLLTECTWHKHNNLDQLMA